MENSAETNAPFIFWLIEHLWGNKSQSVNVSSDEDVNGTPNHLRGMYIFYLDSGKVQYPIYVGITSRNFRVRFKEHLSRPAGVIYQWMNRHFPLNDYTRVLPLQAILIPNIYPIEAKMMESVLLEAFDFCLNVGENGQSRMYLELAAQFRPEDSKQNFDIHFGNIMGEINQVCASYYG